MNRLLRFFIPLLVVIPIGAVGQHKTKESFTSAEKGYALTFPRDHGSHRAYETEWWYYTGHLVSAGTDPLQEQTEFSFQLTFFRRARAPGGDEYSQLYLAHAALLDAKEERFLHDSVAAGGGVRLAEAREGMLDVWNHDWRATALRGTHILEFSFPEVDPQEPVSVRLFAEPTREPVLHGEEGYSKKGECPSCASHYYSLPGLRLSGHVLRGTKLLPVDGVGWMDHEFMSSALARGQQGWDWLWLQRGPDEWIMLSRVRHKQRARDYLFGTYIKGEQSVSLKKGDFSLVPRRRWRSKETGAKYPLELELEIPTLGIKETVSPLADAQELRFDEGEGVRAYWEGAIISDKGSKGFLELTGYSEGMEGSF